MPYNNDRRASCALWGDREHVRRRIDVKLLLFAWVAISSLALPSAGAPVVQGGTTLVVDRVAVASEATVVSRLGEETVTLTGWADVERSNPQDAGEGLTVTAIEVTNLELQGGTAVGAIRVRERANEGSSYVSSGEVRTLMPGQEFPASSSIDLFVDVSVPASGGPSSPHVAQIHNEWPLRLTPRAPGDGPGMSYSGKPGLPGTSENPDLGCVTTHRSELATCEATIAEWPPSGVVYELYPVFEVDNDGDGLIDEDTGDDDSDGLMDEDRPGPDPVTPGSVLSCQVNGQQDPDCDGVEGEDSPFELCAQATCDDDGDGRLDEDPACVPLVNQYDRHEKNGFCIRQLRLEFSPGLPSFSVAAGGPGNRRPADILGLAPPLRPEPLPAAVSGNDSFADAWALGALPFTGQQSTVGMTVEHVATPLQLPSSEEAETNPPPPANPTNGDGDGYEVNPTNAFDDDGLYAVDVDSGSSPLGFNTECFVAANDPSRDRHRFKEFGFPVASLSQVSGIEVELQAKAQSILAGTRICVQISFDGGENWAPFPLSAQPIGTVEATYVLGGPRTTWTITPPSPANLTDELFQVRLTNVATSPDQDFLLDSLGVRVYEFSEPQPCAQIASTVWYAFTPPTPGEIVIDTQGSDFNTALAVYTGDDIYGLTNLACNDGVEDAAVVTLQVTGGQTYYIQAGGVNGATGSLALNVSEAAGAAPYVQIPCEALGLTPDGCDSGDDGDQDDVDAVASGADLPQGAAASFFSVSSGAVGAMGSGVGQQTACPTAEPESDIFGSSGGGDNFQVFDGNGPIGTCLAAFPLQLVEAASRDDLNALYTGNVADVDPDGDGVPESAIYFSLTENSPSLAALGASGGDVLRAVGGEMPTMYVTGATLGLQPGDDVDSLCLIENGDGAYSDADDTLYFSLAAGSPTLSAAGLQSGDLLSPGPVPSVVLSAADLGLQEGDDLDALACHAVLAQPDTQALHISASGSRIAAGESATLPTILHARSDGPRSTAEVLLEASASSTVVLRWLPEQGDICLQDGSEVTCGETSVDGLRFQQEFGSGPRETVKRDIHLTCVSPGQQTVALKATIVSQAGEPVPQIDGVEGALTVFCEPSGSLTEADLRVDTVFLPQVVPIATGQQRTLELDVVGANDGPPGLQPGPLPAETRVRVGGTGDVAFRWVAEEGDACIADEIVVDCSSPAINELRLLSSSVAGLRYYEERSLMVTCEQSGVAWGVISAWSMGPSGTVDPDAGNNGWTGSFVVLCLPDGAPDLDRDRISSPVEIASGLSQSEADSDGDTLRDELDPAGAEPDYDGDGCSDGVERGARALQGGVRDPQNPFDFFDTPPRDGVVNSSDLFRVVGRFGSSIGANGSYEADFDRASRGGPTTLGPGDGAITAVDIFLNAGQFGHSCG